MSPIFGPAYVDFGRLTTTTLAAVEGRRHLSLTNEIRDALREAFFQYVALDRRS
ncbi:MAG: hypothetical protein WBA31_05865 [Candidatus Dormiibacterota bacterium]